MFVLLSVCLAWGRFTISHGGERNYRPILRLLLGLLSDWDKVLIEGPTRLARVFALALRLLYSAFEQFWSFAFLFYLRN